MLVAAAREKDTYTEKQSARLHVSILTGSKVNRLECAVGDTCAEGQVSPEARNGNQRAEKQELRPGRRAPHRTRRRLCGYWRGWSRAGGDRRFPGWRRCAHSNGRAGFPGCGCW